MNTIGLILEIIKASSYQQTKFDLNWNSLLLSSEHQSFPRLYASRVFLTLLELFQTCGCGRDNERWQWNLHLGDFSRAIWIPAFSLHVYSEGERDKKQIEGCKHAREKEALSVQLPQLSCFLIKILIHGNWPVNPC